ncbi:MAG TPA: dTDP-4-dehydrorhamnose reductase [Lapillicoccus sp.]|nr:dTDP-4-dehydrorhamnose reductase [Lapillicoccus sp.]
MRVVVAGAGGMLGRSLVATLEAAGHDVRPGTRPSVDIRSLADCRAAAQDADVVVNAAAWTDVDGAEAAEAAAFAVNATGAANLAVAAREAGAGLVHVSTDYVFDGQATAPYREDAPLNPLGAYGRTKAAGEWAVRAEHPAPLLVRTAWLYGPGATSFVATMARLADERDTVDVVDDQRGQPTTTTDVAAYVLTLLERHAPAGTYHATSEGETTWFGLARAVFEELGHDPDRVRPTTTDAFPRPAPRPSYSVLGHDRGDAVGARMPSWRAALSATLPGVLEHARS